MDININNLKVHGYIGVSDEEKQVGQEFIIRIMLSLRDDYSYNKDDLNTTVDYAEVMKCIVDYFETKRCDLIETACDDIARMLLQDYDIIDAIQVEIHKPNAPVDVEFDDVYVSCHKKRNKAYLSLGSNMGDKHKNIEGAIAKLKSVAGIRNVKCSKLYDTKPYGKTDQDDFVNAVCEIETYLTPYELLDAINDIEDKFGRVRVERWGPRTLDIDIVLFGDMIINTPRLCVPHIDMHNREFVLKPLVEIAPHAYNPMLCKRAKDMYEELR